MLNVLKQLRAKAMGRRRFLARAGMVGAGAIAAGALGQNEAQAAFAKKGRFAGQTISDADILNFALNLEYLEAEYYTYAVTGQGIQALGIGVDGVGTPGGVTIKANPKVPFTTPAFEQYAREIAADEQAHVRFLRTALGSAKVARPAIDLLESFNTAAAAAGIGPAFDPFANEVNFLLGAFIFEDVGVTAYKGASPFVRDAAYLEAAAGILGVEAYHAGSIRTSLYAIGQQNPAVITLAQQISDLRDGADGAGDTDQGVTDANNQANIVPADGNGLAYSRTFDQVLRIAYLGKAPGAGGGFFPSLTNGLIK